MSFSMEGHEMTLKEIELEAQDVMADDLCCGCQMNEYSHYEDPDWIRKYIHSVPGAPCLHALLRKFYLYVTLTLEKR